MHQRPCRNCVLANRPCTYAVRDREVTISKTYLEKLERGLARINTRATASDSARQPSDNSPQGVTSGPSPRQPFDPVAENPDANVFVSRLKEIQFSHLSPHSDTHAQSDYSDLSSTHPPRYEYFGLNFDTLHAQCTFKLPPYPYVIYLLDQFGIYLGHDWHWFRLTKFRQNLHDIYMTVDSPESKDRTLMCQLLVVLALAESVDASRELEIDQRADDDATMDGLPTITTTATAATSPPGKEFFEQALALFNVPYEDASVEHIEVLNMFLHKASTSSDQSTMEREHHKRVWWSTFCLDRLTSTQRGLPPTLNADQTDLSYPSSVGLGTEEIGDFTDPDFLTARIQLTVIQAGNSEALSRCTGDEAGVIESVLRPMLQRLVAWKESLPAHMAFETESNILRSSSSLAFKRSLANLHLRYNQCLLLLLRPVLFKLIAYIFSNQEMSAAQPYLEELNNISIISARANLRIMIQLRAYGLLSKSILRIDTARLGFMENMHLFTSLMILYLGISTKSRMSGTFYRDVDDVALYKSGKEVLVYTMQSGSLAAKGHLNTLKDVEDLGTVIATDKGPETYQEGEGGQGNVDELMSQFLQGDVDEWMSQFLQIDNGSRAPSC
ncbi:hypothetical protein FSARC_6843 [Fusarium sarcochroum]|uniref:Xylanolytic transcriptional activator regulatory domain-containing protein n=1 Tax=Fusarium sarcochroum TaxID=1208366 RepID=A0A8H4TWL9_9HYPO|nr:hypothetical protein FSARC_6843 [Fusarium sarcochroum]